jgi:hypothetical protein
MYFHFTFQPQGKKFSQKNILKNFLSNVGQVPRLKKMKTKWKQFLLIENEKFGRNLSSLYRQQVDSNSGRKKTQGVNFTNILWAAFAPNPCAKKLQTQIVST